MDVKKQLDTILLGLSGGVKSGIVAYLLNIQHYNLHALTVDIGQTHRELGFDYPGLSPDDIKAIKSFCLKLGITHHLVSAADEFNELVVNKEVARYIEGKTSHFRIEADQFILQKIFHKSRELGIEKIASGHLGKMISSKIYQNNVHVEDDSFYLGHLSKDVLESLVLPLGDLKDDEIEKLRINFGIENSHKDEEIGSSSIESSIPNSLVVNGTSSYSSRKFFLENVHLFSEHELYKSFDAQVLTEDHQKFNAYIVPRTFNSFIIEFEEERNFNVGEAISIMIPSGKNLKMIAQGEIKVLKETPSEEDSSIFRF